MKGVMLTLVGSLHWHDYIKLFNLFPKTYHAYFTCLSDDYLHYGSDHDYYLYNVATKKYLSSSGSSTDVILNVRHSYLPAVTVYHNV